MPWSAVLLPMPAGTICRRSTCGCGVRAKPAAAAPKEEDAPAAPWESNPGAGSPFGHQGAARASRRPRTRPKPSSAASSAQATIFKPVE